jgi:hypothetical protein
VVIPPSRRLRFVFLLSVPIAGAIAACTAGEEISYQDANLTPDGAVVEAGREGGPPIPVVDGGFILPIRGFDGSTTIPPLPDGPLPCGTGGLDLEGGACDPTEGLGCCLLKNGGVPDPASNQCNWQGFYFQGGTTFCKTQGDVFLSCLGSDPDSMCCWQNDNAGLFHTRYRANCDGGFEACNIAAKGLCSDGTVCQSAFCGGVEVGFCGATSPCPQ